MVCNSWADVRVVVVVVVVVLRLWRGFRPDTAGVTLD
jgi:hypothetical protein